MPYIYEVCKNGYLTPDVIGEMTQNLNQDGYFFIRMMAVSDESILEIENSISNIELIHAQEIVCEANMHGDYYMVHADGDGIKGIIDGFRMICRMERVDTELLQDFGNAFEEFFHNNGGVIF
jgi:hypothetical protein